MVIVSVEDQTEEILSDAAFHERYAFWLGDENTIAYHRDVPGTLEFGSELVRIQRDSEGEWSTPEVIIDRLRLGAHWSTEAKMIVYSVGSTAGQTIHVWDPETEQSRAFAETTNLNPGDPMWSRDGNTIYFLSAATTENQSFWAIPLQGGSPRKIIDLSGMEIGIGAPTVGEKRIYYTISKIESDIWVLDLEEK